MSDEVVNMIQSVSEPHSVEAQAYGSRNANSWLTNRCLRLFAVRLFYLLQQASNESLGLLTEPNNYLLAQGLSPRMPHLTQC